MSKTQMLIMQLFPFPPLPPPPAPLPPPPPSPPPPSSYPNFESLCHSCRTPLGIISLCWILVEGSQAQDMISSHYYHPSSPPSTPPLIHCSLSTTHHWISLLSLVGVACLCVCVCVSLSLSLSLFYIIALCRIVRSVASVCNV